MIQLLDDALSQSRRPPAPRGRGSDRAGVPAVRGSVRGRSGTPPGRLRQGRTRFGFVVESRELRETLKTQFDMLWKISTPIEFDPGSAETFLEAHGI
jgi:hypothetical protein